jgi:hypothetical protein
MSIRYFAVLLVSGLVLSLAGTASAVPMLQLDIEDGAYEPGSETIVITSPVFTVRAYLRGDGDLGQEYFLSIALRPKTGPEGADLGSFIVNGEKILVTDGMVYGVPPYEAFIEHDGGDLGKHDIYETYFKEIGFTFSASNLADTRNTADNPGLAIDLAVGDPAWTGGSSYYADFVIDAANLDLGLGLHFDLYSTKLGQKKPNGDIDVDQFAPFSHDAEYVPEPASLAVWGVLGLAILGASRRTRRLFRRPR